MNLRQMLSTLVIVAVIAVTWSLRVDAGSRRRGNPLDGMNMVQWTESWCLEGETYSAEWRVPPSEKWEPIPFGAKLVPNDGIAHSPGVNVLFRACCVKGNERGCIEAGPEPVTEPYPHIYSVGGGRTGLKT